MKKKITAFIMATITFATTSFMNCFTENNFIETVQAVETTHIWDGTADIDWYGYGDVTEYHITTPEQLAGLAVLVNNGGGMGKETFYLDTDIYLNDISDYENWGTNPPANEWVSIGDTENYFSGRFYGQGHTIYGMYQNLKGDGDMRNSGSNSKVYGGFFGQSDGKITELNISDSIINCSDYYDACIGGVVGYYGSDSCANYCTFNGKINAVNNLDACCSGIANGKSNWGCINYGDIYVKGYIASKIEDGDTYAVASSSSAYGIGGSYTYNCHNYGNITAIGYHSYSSGISNSKRYGYSSNECNSNNCINEGTISSVTERNKNLTYWATPAAYSGGISSYKGMITNCYNIGNVTSESDYGSCYCGGLNGTSGSAKNSCFLFGTCKQGFGEGDNGNTYFRSEKNMKSPEFLDFIGDGYVYVENEFPMLSWEANLAGLNNSFWDKNICYKITSENEVMAVGLGVHESVVLIPKKVEYNGTIYSVTGVDEEDFELRGVNYILSQSGDVNGDGEVNIADAVMLQEWLLGASKDLTYWQNADLCEDGKIDVFDMIEMRKLLTQS